MPLPPGGPAGSLACPPEPSTATRILLSHRPFCRAPACRQPQLVWARHCKYASVCATPDRFPMELLCIGDLHLGRSPARASAAVEDVAAEALGPRAAWQRCIEYALERGVAAVVLTGDLVEHPRDRYEAFGDLKHGVEQLRSAGIEVIAVAGNHDHEVLPELAAAIDGLTLLGADGRWAAHVVRGAEAGIELVGWSFRGERAGSPLARADELPARTAGDLPRVGVLHCDRDGSREAYAPVRAATLAAADVEGWLLGHIHKPDPPGEHGPNGYLGSVVGLDPTEDGAHGPWLLEVTAGGRLRFEQVVLAPLRWGRREIDVSGLESAGGVHPRIVEALQTLDAEVSREAHQRPLAVGVRLVLTGRTALRGELREALRDPDPRERPVVLGETTYFIDELRLDALPAIDLERRARSADPAGRLAHLLLVLDGPDSDERRDLLARARTRLDDTARESPFAGLDVPPLAHEETARHLREAGLDALDRLVDQEGER